MKKSKSTVVVVGNKFGGVVTATPQYGYILLEQKVTLPYRKYSQYINTDIRHAVLVDDVIRLVDLQLQPGDQLPGKIVVIQQLFPIGDNLDEGLLTDQTGRPIKISGNLIYEHSYYTEDADEGDVFITDSKGL